MRNTLSDKKNKPNDHKGTHASIRNYRLKISLVTTGIARISGILLQAISLPIAAAALGAQAFSLYAMVAAILAWLTLSNMGLSHAVTLEVASSSNPSDTRHKEIYLARALLVAVSISAITGGIVLLLMEVGIFEIIFNKTNGEKGYPKIEIIFVLFVFLATQVFSIFEGYQLAEQQQYKLNIYMAFGTLLSAICVSISAAWEPTVLCILVSVHMPVLIARFANTLNVTQKVKLKILDFRVRKWEEISPIIARGIQFVSGTTISNFLCHPFTVIVVGATVPVSQSASYAAVINAILLAVSILGHVMSPIRGAVPEAFLRGELGWIKRAYRISLCAMILYAAVPSLILIFYGSSFFDFWYQGMVSPDSVMLIGAGVYLMLYCIETVHYNFLICIGYLEESSRIVFAKGLLVAGVSVPISVYLGATYVMWFIVASIGLVSCLPLIYYAQHSILKRS
jgi:O-antigen/teichoic acid export membrane protein